ncbi:uncharacterized protein LOC117322878 [Pecten maximus]|uniref:uncharacterized protein LOC117322878 n=1 Tax=Pecten maximus TaxID=6579 RepID=UPI0014580124|nr:uncharacterized protein LOC117322878 [Pecten maximus]
MYAEPPYICVGSINMYRPVVLLSFFLLSVTSACQYNSQIKCELTNGTVVFLDSSSFCCDGQVLLKYLDGKQQCCCQDSIATEKQEVYDPEQHICCNGRKFPRQNTLGQQQACCESKVFVLTRSNLCCVPQPYEDHPTAVLYNSYVGENDTCCGNVKYDKNTKICCTDTSYNYTLYDNDPNKICCGRKYIPHATHVCKMNQKTGQATSMLKFISSCGNTDIDNRKDLCCNGHPHLNVVPISSYSCCGNGTYNINIHSCCNNAHAIPKNMECCGSNPNGYNSRTHRCCNGVSLEISRDSDQCCGGGIIDLETQNCCNGQTYDKSTFKICRDSNNRCSAARITDECCGWEALDHTSVCCKAGTNYDYQYFQTQKERSSQNKCCASYSKSSTEAKPYSDQTEECQRGLKPNVTKKLNQLRCGSTYYDQNTDLCCFNILYINATLHGQMCCQHNVFNPATQSCCKDNRVYNSTSCPRFCKSRQYSPVSQICCGGHVHANLPGRKCCGKQTFDPREQRCCGSKAVNKPKKCRKPNHPICKWLCEQDEKKIRRNIRTGKIDICKTNGYVARIGQKNNIRQVTRIQLEGGGFRLYNHNQNPFKVKKLFHHTCVCDKEPREEVRRKIVVITDKSIRDIKVELTDSDYILPYTNKVRKTLMKHWKERCATPTSLVTADVVDEIFDFIKVKLDKQRIARFYE